MIAGKRLNIEGKEIQCPSAPLFYLKSNGTVVDIDQSHYIIDLAFSRCVSNDVELWKMDSKGAWHLIRRMRGGKEKQDE